MNLTDAIKTRLTLLSFFQFFVWGAWLISLGGYMIVTLKFTGVEVGSIFSTMGIASLFMPAIRLASIRVVSVTRLSRTLPGSRCRLTVPKV